jgi:hypothetical protein
MNVYVLFRPEDNLILGVFSSEEHAEKYQNSCHDSGRDIEISVHEIDEYLSHVSSEFSPDEKGWIG